MAGSINRYKTTEEQIKAILEALSGDDNKYGVILRAKGIVPAPEGEWDMILNTDDPRYGGKRVQPEAVRYPVLSYDAAGCRRWPRAHCDLFVYGCRWKLSRHPLDERQRAHVRHLDPA